MLVKSDIIDVLNKAFKQTGKLRKGQTQLLFDCPFCNRRDGFKKLEICLDGARFGFSHCWRCNAKSRSFGALLRKLKAAPELRELMFQLSGEVKKYKRTTSIVKKNIAELALPDEFISLSKPSNTIEYRNAITYLKTRSITSEDILRYNIGYAEEGDYAYHIIIPSYDMDNKLNFFVGRRYYNTEGILPHKKPFSTMNIIGMENMINWDYPEITLCEGVFDMLAIRINTIPLFGKYLSKKLREKIISSGIKRVNMVLDNDAIDDAIENCKLLMKSGINVHLITLKEKDPSKMGFSAIHDLIRNSIPFDWEQLMWYNLTKL